MRSFAVLTFFLLTAPACADSTPSAAFEVEVVRDITYRDLYAGEDAAAGKNQLDLYLPQGKKDCPVLFFVHGGGWRHGDKKFLGVYSALGRFWAKQGIATVVTNYRLSPAVQHPEHIKDVVQAFAWTHKNIQRYGGRADQIYVCGHSAGGHLVSLLSTDESYLKSVGLNQSAIRGAIPISGVYDITALGTLFSSAFGTDSRERQQASPLVHVKGKHPPFLILYADGDFPTCDQMSTRFCEALQTCHCEASVVEVKRANHATVILKASLADDPVVRAIREFMAKH